jgi:hypothetical protein
MHDLQTIDPVLYGELAATLNLYAALARYGSPTLGGKFLYAGELTPETARLVRAANIAGAASLTATADLSMQRATVRDGIADFLVTNLDEALRILKNEIRKRQTVAVCISAAPQAIEAEMRERGVFPDLPSQIEPQPLRLDDIFFAVADPPSDFEARALTLIPESDEFTRRWLRLSPRYLGPRARRIRSLACSRAIADQLIL